MEETEETLSVSELVVYHIIQEIISEGGNLLYQNYISSKSVQFSAESLSAMIVSTVESYFFRFDTGETMIWADDIEPAPSSIDTWARNAIPVKKKIKMPQTNQSPYATMQDAKSVVSYTSRRSVAGKLIKGGKGKNLKENSAIEETATPVPIPQPKNELNDEEEMLRGKKEREFKKRKEEAERLKKIKEEENERDKKLQKETEEMKNKTFTYDHKGKILFVNPVKYDNFPNTYSAVRYLSQEPVKEEVKLPVKKQPPRDFGSVKRNRTAPMQEQEWVKNITSMQTPLIESIKLNPGVTYIEGGRSKLPPTEVIGDKKTMSRRQYNELYQTQLAPILKTGLIIEKSPSVSSSESLKNLEEKKDIMDSIPDYEGINSFDEQIEKISNSISPVRSQQYGKIRYYGHSVDLSETAGPTERFNAEIVKSKNWGLNPPIKEPKIVDRIPKRPSSKQMRELYGDILKKPKDKPFITPKELWENKAPQMKKPRDRPNIERVDKKTRMPPPPYGYTMINAFPEMIGLGSLGNGNSMSIK